MIVDERTITYINSLEQGDSEILSVIAKEAAASFVPIIRKETASFLRTLVVMKQPKRILEVGTATGYSALFMSEGMPEGCTITTIEKYEKRIPIARENFKRAGKESVITLLEGDAADILKTLDAPYDFIFMDAAKGQYIHFLPEVLRLLPVGGVLVSDNVLQDGDIIESRFAVARRDRTIHARMREYLYTIKHMDCLQTAVVPIGDGVTVSVKIKE
ncbi:O-methyltransferase [Fusibacillus kribbianus]|uniref:tRNA 5-hydroxyuridine methyltransferase n=1 Tax=Fusibacillus kribbianus TaxID=3044208 RepID=A0AAP4EZT8_9FIRM|nr:O-methyltransferase [Ruminococcus sp. YH-rum2234]MDI9242275.1 O-methyltransferase [Ruminococcus sp. YH-rum2234]